MDEGGEKGKGRCHLLNFESPSRSVPSPAASTSAAVTPPKKQLKPNRSATTLVQSSSAMYHANYPKSTDTDIVLETVEGRRFATQQLFLRAASAVFRDMLLIGSDSYSSSNSVEGLPVITLSERGDIVQRFLSLLQPAPVVVPLPVIDIATLDELLTMCDKYDAPLVGRWAALRFFPRILVVEPMVHVAVAIIHLQYETRPYLEDAIRRIGSVSLPSGAVDLPGPHFSAAGTDRDRYDEIREGNRLLDVSDIPSSYFKRLAVEDVVEIARMQMRILQESSYDYKKAAEDFKVHGQANAA